MLGCPREIFCRERPSEGQKPRLSWGDVAKKNFGSQALGMPFATDLAGTGLMEALSVVNPETASVGQRGNPSRVPAVSTYIDKLTGVV